MGFRPRDKRDPGMISATGAVVASQLRLYNAAMTGLPAGNEPMQRTPIGEIARRLDAVYGRRRWRCHGCAIDELIATVLSQHTSDANTDRAFRSLKERFPTWHDVIEASTAELAETIRTGGLANQKAPRIQAMIRAILARHGSLDLT